MPKLVVPMENFDLAALIQDATTFWGGPGSVRIEPEDPNLKETSELLDWLVEHEECEILIPFSESCVDMKPIRCVDGSFVDPSAPSLSQELLDSTVLAEDAGYSFSIGVLDGRLEINSCADGELVEIREHAGIFEKPMLAFIERYRR